MVVDGVADLPVTAGEAVATARKQGSELDEETVELMETREKGLQPSFKKIVEQFVPAES